MRVLYYEMRKIWRPHLLLALLVLGVMHYFLFMEYSIAYFPDGHPALEAYELTREWTEKYGTTLEPDEYEDAKKGYDALIAEADAVIAGYTRFAEKGIASWADFQASQPDAAGEAADGYRELQHILYSSEADFIGFRIQEYSGMLFGYEAREESLELSLNPQTPAEEKRFQELRTEPRLNNISCSQCQQNLWDYVFYVTVFAIGSAAVLLTPSGAAENLCQMPAELWTTRLGRRVICYQFAAALLSAVLLFLLELLVYGGIYATLGTQFFWNSPVQSFLWWDIFWFDLTYGQYVLCSLAIALALMLGTAGFVFVFSHSSANYISAVLKAIPLLVVLVFAAAGSLIRLFTSENALYKRTLFMGIEAIVILFLLAAALLTGLIFLRKRLRKELL